MSRRNQALQRLRDYRDAIIDRITEAVLEDDQFGKVNGWTRNDEEVTELGDRLWRLNQTINNIPPESVAAGEVAFVNPPGNATHSFTITQGVVMPTWDDFIANIEAEDRIEASRVLGLLAQLDPNLAFQATQVFAAQYALNPDFKGKAMSLRAQLNASVNGSLVLIHELFGITGTKAFNIYNSLKVAV